MLAVQGAIQVLPPEVVERIAAGEVIERPVSVVRELLDNALDAGAHEVRVDVRGGGLRSIRVTDDGSGIPAEQVDLALRHHATSKLRDASDLPEVHTLGFRGEALPSIVAVADVSILTCTHHSHLGVRLETRGGQIVERGFAARTPGTTVTVRNLFATLPARLKFIGSARAESALVTQLLRRYALAHPAVRFILTLDGHPSLRTGGAGLEGAVTDVFGPAVAASLLPFGPIAVGPARVSGLISARHVTRSSRQHIAVMVNGRCVQSRALLAAFEDGYRPLLPRGRHPIALLIIDTPRERVDVNVHPSKQEVKLREEGEIGIAVRAAARDVLGRFLSAPEDVSYALGPAQVELPRMVAEGPPEWDRATGQRLREAHVTGQVHGSLILIEDEAGIYLVDQHRAHERAIYDLLCRQHAEGRAGQMLLEPLHIQLTAAQRGRLEPRLPELTALGFACEWFGGRSFLVRSVPVIPEVTDLPNVVENLLDMASGDESDWQHRLLTSIACRAATKRGRILTISQCRELINLLAETESPAACPHGSPIILQFDERFLKRQFNW